MARDAAAETGASKDDIDDLFGWLQAERAKVARITTKKAYAAWSSQVLPSDLCARDGTMIDDDLMARGACPFGGSSLGHSVEWGLPAACVSVCA